MNSVSELAIFMIVRIDSPSRLRNCEISLKYYSTIVKYIYIIEVDVESLIPTSIKESFTNVVFLFIENKSIVFHRTHYMNYGFRTLKERHNYIAHIDIDILVPFQQLVEAYAKIVEGNIPMVIPYNGECISLCEDTTMAIYYGNNYVCGQNKDIGDRMFGNHSFGGAYIVNIHLYQKFGLENENFIGWGPEDLERVIRLDILGYPPHRIEGCIFHLNHYRGKNSGDHFDYVFYQTRKELSRVCSMSKEELIRYIHTWSWI